MGPGSPGNSFTSLSLAVPLSGNLYLLTVWLGDSKELNLLFSFFFCKIFNFRLKLGCLMPFLKT